jgi:hypothetical protein
MNFRNIGLILEWYRRFVGSDKGLWKERDTIYNSCNNNNKHEFGTGFIVTGRMRNFIMDFNAVNERICVLRFKGRFHNYPLINANAPTENQFYNILEKTEHPQYKTG